MFSGKLKIFFRPDSCSKMCISKRLKYQILVHLFASYKLRSLEQKLIRQSDCPEIDNIILLFNYLFFRNAVVTTAIFNKYSTFEYTNKQLVNTNDYCMPLKLKRQCTVQYEDCPTESHHKKHQENENINVQNFKRDILNIFIKTGFMENNGVVQIKNTPENDCMFNNLICEWNKTVCPQKRINVIVRKYGNKCY